MPRSNGKQKNPLSGSTAGLNYIQFMSDPLSGSRVRYAYYTDYVYDVYANYNFKLENMAVSHYFSPRLTTCRQIT
jgi:hypothetical protein